MGWSKFLKVGISNAPIITEEIDQRIQMADGEVGVILNLQDL